MTLLLDLLYGLLVCIGWPLLIVRRVRRGPGSLAIGERLGDVPSRHVSAHCVWLHGVSLGEINATRTIVAELYKRAPNTTIVVSSTTQTGLARASEMYPKLTVFRFPLDFSFIIRRVLRRIRPSAIVLMELEAWPNLVEVAAANNIPVLIANGRVTEDGSMKRFDKPLVRWLARRMFSKLAWVGAQDETYGERFRRLGVPERKVEITGSIKFDAAEISDRIDGQDELARAMTIDTAKPLLVCGSTGPGEEALILDAYAELVAAHADLQLAIIPRKPERFEDVARLIVAREFTCLRRGGAPPMVPPPAVREPRAVFLGDTMGELRKFYALATVVFVGRSLAPLGGSDVMEVAALAKPILVGPHTDNFTEPVALLCARNACRIVRDARELARETSELLGSPGACREMGAAGRAAIESKRGATERTVERILEIGRIV